MQRSKFLRSAVAGVALLLVGAGASVAHAASPAAPTPVPTITTLPLLGVQLTVDVTTGAGGTLSSVAVNPADGLTATTVKPNKVVFVNEDGTAKVYVRGRDGGQRVEVRAGAIGDVSGDGGWSGDVFGNGTATTVGFTIGATAEGGPDITNVTTSDATAVIGATEYGDGDGHHEGHHDDDDDEVVLTATAKITFTSGGQSRTLTIRAMVRTDDDGDTSAKVGVTLGKLRGVVQPIEAAVGAKTWTGLLCDGTTATINYTVNADGSLTDVTATPEPDRIRNDGDRRIEVRFSSDERVSIRASVNDEGIKLSIDEKIRCEDAPDPSVNTPTSTNPDDDHDGDHHDGHEDDHGDHDDDHGDHDDDRGDDDDHDDDHGGDRGDDHGDREHD